MSEGLNPAQQDAVEHRLGPLLILAGAGSGKTRVITHRIAKLVARGAAPWRILAVTFTNKAAGEMRERIARLVDEEAAKRLWIGTFHATCAKLLRIHAEAAGLPRDFLVFDDSDSRSLMIRVMKDLGVSDRTATPRTLLGAIDRAKNDGISDGEFQGGDFMSDIVARVYPEYQRRLRASGALDFGDLLLEMLRLCRDPRLGPELAGRFDHVLVDEFQDTNKVQYALVRHLASRTRNLCVVGDDDQAIYGWRGADPRNILDFDKDWPDCKVVKLEQNYRSTQTVLDAANAVIARNRERKQKHLFTDEGQGDPILYFTAPDERREAGFVVQAIRHFESSEERALDEFAVFYRTHAQSRAVEEALRAADIPYTVVGGTRFYDRAEVKDLLAYLRVVANPADEVSLDRIVNVPPRGIGDGTVDKLRELAALHNATLWDAMRAAAGRVPVEKPRKRAVAPSPQASLFAPEAEAAPAPVVTTDVLGSGPKKKLAAFVSLVEELREAAGHLHLAELAERVLERSGYLEMLDAQGTQEAADRRENLGELVQSLRDYEATTDEASLVGWLERVSLVAPADTQAKGVALMTVHAAKGLEFPVAFLTGLEEGTFPRVDRDGDPRAGIEEERRLAYVAITRARERLVLTNAARRQRWSDPPGTVATTPLLDAGDPRSLHESRFGGDIPEALLARPVPPPRRKPAGERLREAFTKGRRVEDRGEGITVEREDMPAYDDDAPVQAVESDEPATVIARGARVRHNVFGEGEVLSTSGRGDRALLKVRFGAETKTILARFLEPA